MIEPEQNMDEQWLPASGWAEWDRFVEAHPLGGVVHTSAWKAVLEASFPHIRGRCSILARTEHGGIGAGLPVYTVASRLLGTRLVSIPFGTLSDPLVEDGSQLSRLMAALRQEVRPGGPRRVEIRCTNAPRFPLEKDWRVETSFKHHVLPLNRSEPKLLASMHPRAVRAMLKRGEQAGLRYRGDDGIMSLHRFYRLFLRTRRRLALPPIPFAFFEAMHEHLVPLGALSYALVESGSDLAAAGLVLKFRGISAIEYLGDRIDYRRRGANQVLYWETIREAMREGRTVFSFGRTAAGNEGLLQYKRRWDARETDLRTLVFPARERVPGASEQDRWQYRAVRRLCAALPMPLYRILGRVCYRHMG